MGFWVRFALLILNSLWVSLACLLLVPFLWGRPILNIIFARWLSWSNQKILGIRVEVKGLEKLKNQGSVVFVANHQSGLDLVTFGTTIPNGTVCIGKKELRWIPLFGLFFEGAGNVMLDRQNREKAISTMETVAKYLKQKNLSVWIFPEGTRNPGDGPLLPFKKGAFHLAKAMDCPIIPIVGEPLKRYFDFKKRFIRPGPVKIEVMDPIVSEEKMDEFMETLRSKMERKILEL